VGQDNSFLRLVLFRYLLSYLFRLPGHHWLQTLHSSFQLLANMLQAFGIIDAKSLPSPPPSASWPPMSEWKATNLKCFTSLSGSLALPLFRRSVIFGDRFQRRTRAIWLTWANSGWLLALFSHLPWYPVHMDTISHRVPGPLVVSFNDVPNFPNVKDLRPVSFHLPEQCKVSQ
jgi:hypothetical protein